MRSVMGCDIVGATSLGAASVAKVLLGGADLVLPEWARSIIAIIPQINIDVPTVSESVIAKVILESEDFNVGPFEALAAPASSCLGATVAPAISKAEKYLVNCPVQGGSKLSVYGQALVANTAAPIMSCGVVISSEPPAGPQRFAKMGTLTETGIVASTDIAGTQYSISKGKEIVELFGTMLPDTVAAADAMSGYIRYSSSEFERPTPLKLPLASVPGGLSTIFSTKVDGISRIPVSVPLVPGQKNIQDYLQMDLAPAATGHFVSGIIVQ